MSGFLFLAILLLINLSSVVATCVIEEVCKASQDPPSCRDSLSSFMPPKATVLEAIQCALNVSLKNLATGGEMVHDILSESPASPNRSYAATSCLEFVGYAEYRMRSAGEALPGGGLKNVRAWMSASLAYEYDCWSALKYVNDTSLVNKTMAFFNSSVIRSSSDTLAMMVNYDVFGGNTTSWGQVKTERDNFWEPVISSGLTVRPITSLKADKTVCKKLGKRCDYKTVQEAVNACPDNSSKRCVIQIRSGVYNETVRVPLEKINLAMIGEGIGKTVITGSMNFGLQGVSTYNSATLGVVGDGFMARGLTIQNTAGPNAHQAVAFRSDSDLSIIENCEFLGNQDTLYAHSLRQHYKSCRIQGNIDFIFGQSAAFFQDCLILVAPRQVETGKVVCNAVTAHGRIHPAQSTGFVFHKCVVNGTDAYMGQYRGKPSFYNTYLGRPWKLYSRTVFLNSDLGVIVSPEGWMRWKEDFALSTLYYGELDNKGPGSDERRTTRVNWSSEIPPEHASAYTVENFIQEKQ